MKNTDMATAVVDFDTLTVQIIDTWSIGHSEPILDQQNDLELLKHEVTPLLTTIVFRRLMKTNDPFNKILVFNETYQFCVAWGGRFGQRLLDHQANYTSFTVKLNNSFLSSTSTPPGETFYATVYQWHKDLLKVYWLYYADALIIWVRCFKYYTWYIWVHSVGFVALSASSIFLISYLLFSRLSVFKLIEDGYWYWHFVIGTIFLVLLTIQFGLGLFVKYSLKYKFKTQYLTLTKNTHFYLSILIYLLAKVSVSLGESTSKFQRGKPQVPAYLKIFIGPICILLFEILLKYFHRLFYLAKFDKKHEMTQDQRALVELLNSGKTNEQIQERFPKMTWVLYRNRIYDLTNFTHPGGNHLLDFINGQDLQKYLYGINSHEVYNSKIHYHSQYALDLLALYEIGSLGAVSSEDLDYTWRINKCSRITQTVCLFEFKNKFGHSLKNSDCSEIAYLGSIYSLQPLNSKKLRLYTCVKSQSREYQENLRILLNMADSCSAKLRKNSSKQSIQSIEVESQNQINCQLDYLPLIVKLYPGQEAVSAKIHSLQNDLSFCINGPFQGIMSLNSSLQHVAVICAGTGVLPFLDMFDLILRKAIHAWTQKQDRTIWKQIKKINISPIHLVHDDIKIQAFLAFKNGEEFLGKETFKQLLKYQGLLDKQYVEIFLRYSEQDSFEEGFDMAHQRFQQHFLQKQIKNIHTIQKFFVCGPNVMNLEIVNSLIRLGVNESKIIPV